jgi:hypothetical protein
VSRKSLLNYRKDAGEPKAAKVGRPATGKKDIYINGEKFVSSVLAARDTGYATDYIGQLVRSGAVEGKMMGRTWYVSRKSLLSYKKSNSLTVRSVAVKTPTQTLPVKKVSALTHLVSRPRSLPAPKPITFVPDVAASLPALSKARPQKSYSRIVRNSVVVSLSLMIIASTSYSWLEFASPATADTVSIKIAESMESVKGFEQATGARLAEVTKPVRAGSSYVALALGSGVKSFFTGLLSGILPPQIPTDATRLAERQTATKAGEGIVVTSESGDHTSAVDRIKSIFSDQVSISTDADGASGIITPVFTSSTSSDKYTYVLVPIKPAK